MKMAQIAELAGVSIATVSRSFHSPHLVRPEIRQRIQKIAQEHNYLYHAPAGDLSRQRSNLIGVLIPTANRSVFGETLMAIQEKAQENYYSIIVGNTLYEKRLEEQLLLQFQERRVAGVIFTGFVIGQEKLIRTLLNQQIPCVVIWEKLEAEDISFVGFDNLKAAQAATEYLISLGHRRIGLIIGPHEKIGRVQKRYYGYRQALKEHRIAFDPELVAVTPQPDLVEGKRAMRRILSLSDLPTAVFAASDRLAIGAMASIKEKGLKVPADMSLVGFDDIDVAAYCDPPLTTVRVPAYKIGQLAVKVLIEAIEKKGEEAKQYSLDSDLIIRESCAEHR